MASFGIVIIAVGKEVIMPISDRHLEILEARGLDPEILARYGVETSGNLGSDCIVIPFYQGGRLVNRKYRTIAGEKRFSQDPGAIKCFWNFDVLLDITLSEQPLIITEGELDALIALQCGFARTVSVPDGAPAEPIGDREDSRKYSYVTDAMAVLEGVKEIVLATDGDRPGINLMNDLAVRLGKARCKWVKYPQGCKDLNEAFVRFGHKGVTQTIARAQWMRVDGIFRMSELPPVPERQVFRVGMPILDNHYRLRPMDFCVVTGIPSHGKTAFLTDVACRMVTEHSWGVAFASFEQQPQIDHRRNYATGSMASLLLTNLQRN